MSGLTGFFFEEYSFQLLSARPVEPGVLGGLKQISPRIGGVHARCELGPRLRAKSIQITAERTGQPIEKVEKDLDRDYYMTADEALAYGLLIM